MIDRNQVQAETAACRRQLRQVFQDQPRRLGGRRVHVKPHKTAALTIEEIAWHLKTSLKWLINHQYPNAPKACPHHCGTIDNCPRGDCRAMNPALRRAILNFFLQWNAGLIRKVYVQGKWRLQVEHPARVSVGAPPGPPPTTRPLTLVIDRETLGLKVK